MLSRTLPGAALAAFFVSSLAAQSPLVAPPGYLGTEGNANNTYPWNRGTQSMRIQFVYDAATFTTQGVVGPILIQGLKYRPDAASITTTWAGGSWPDVQIEMATCPSDYLAVSSTFANNLGSDLLTVHAGPVTVLPGVGLGTTVPHPWYIDIPLTTPFVYDPTVGDLTIDIRLNGAGWTGTSRAADHVSTAANTPLCSRIFATAGHTATTGTVATHYAPVTEFTFVPAAGLFPAFSATPRTGPSPLLVQFTDASFTSDPGGILAWLWDFDNDGNVDSTLPSPSFLYAGCGDFTVNLTVIDALHGSASSTKVNYIRTDQLTAGFTAAPVGGGVFQFTDTTTPIPLTWAWDFDGDGLPDSTLQNPLVQLGSVCSRTVRLDVTRNCRSATLTRNVLFAPAAHNANLTGGSGSGTATTPVGNLFDVQVLASEGILVCGLTTSTYTGIGPYAASVYITDNTYVGKDANIALWRLVGTGQGTMNGGTAGAPSLNQIALNTPFYLPQGNYGVAIYHQAVTGTSYLCSTSSTTGTFPGPDLSIHPSPATAPGLLRTNLFTGTATNGRQWNGTFHYTKVSLNNQGGYGWFGPGCTGSLGVPGNVALTPPAIGSTLTVELTRLPQNLVMYWWGFSNTTSAQGPLPINLSALGAPNCFARVSLDATLVLSGINGTATFLFGLPLTPSIIGLQFFAQGLSLDPAANPLGLVATDAAGFIVGQ